MYCILKSLELVKYIIVTFSLLNKALTGSCDVQFMSSGALLFKPIYSNISIHRVRNIPTYVHMNIKNKEINKQKTCVSLICKNIKWMFQIYLTIVTLLQVLQIT